ncbi:MAG: EAL domain-containing protein, partial [Synergistaceae bacterium]
LEEQNITREMKSALEAGQFVAYYQPKYDLATEEIVGAEALVRWIHPEKGIIPPDKFIPLFERNGFITYLDCHIWEEACKEIRRWIDLGHEPIPISVNLSRVDVYNPLLCEVLGALTTKYKIDPKLLELEITESAYTESTEQLICTVKKLKSMGHTVGMDDFGSGYSSLNMLNELPIDVLKLDMRFMKDANRTNKRSSGNILNFVVGLSKWMDIPVIAEGIETKEQGMFLRGMGCSKGQGYYYSKPMPREQFEELLGKSQAPMDKGRVRAISAFVDLNEMWDSDSSFNAIFNGCVGALAIYEFMGDTLAFVRGNDRYYEMLELNRDDVFSVAKNVIDCIYSDDRDVFLTELRMARDGNAGFEIENRWYIPNSGDLRWFHREMKVIHRAEERTIFLGSLYDITSEKELAESLMRQKNFYEDLVNTVPCGIVRFSNDSDLRVLRVNKAAADLLGFEPGDLDKRPRFYGDYIKNSDPKLKQQMLDILSKMKPGEISTMKYSIISEKGKRVWVHDAFQLVYAEDGSLCGRSVIIDIDDVHG